MSDDLLASRLAAHDPRSGRGWMQVLRDAVAQGTTHLALVLDDLSVQIKQCPARIGEAQRAMADMGRDLGLVVLCSGPDVSDHPESYLGHADSVVVGDPVEAVVAWAGGASEIPGLRGASGGTGRVPVDALGDHTGQDWGDGGTLMRWLAPGAG